MVEPMEEIVLPVKTVRPLGVGDLRLGIPDATSERTQPIINRPSYNGVKRGKTLDAMSQGTIFSDNSQCIS
jgi:hypothetical protein